ncbi:MAG: hypothetical protein RL199_2208, partial [Pseudomonadota bacterium]|jgi:hypothetical protein
MAQHSKGLVLLPPLTALLLSAAVAAADGSPLKKGRDAFEYGDFRLAATLLAPAATLVAEDSERVEARRLLGLSHFFLKEPEQAEAAFVALLKHSPDAALDPFYVPPDAVAFFDAVRERHAAELAPLRVRREVPAVPETAAPAPCAAPAVRVETVSHPSRLVTLLPLGAGQFQNGDTRLGGTMLVAQLAAAATSVVAYWSVEVARGPDGRFGDGVYGAALRASDARLWSGGLFYLLWAASAVDANVRFAPVAADGKTTGR